LSIIILNGCKPELIPDEFSLMSSWMCDILKTNDSQHQWDCILAGTVIA